MKKIISLICAAVLLFSFSAVTYADYVEDSGNVVVSAKLGEFTPIGATDIFESHTVEGKTTTREGRTFKIIYTIENNSDKLINAEDVLKNFKVVIINENTEKAPTVYSERFISKTNIGINNEIKEFTYEKKVETKESVKIYIEFKNKKKDIQSDDCSFSLEHKEETSTTVTETSTTTTTTEATKPEKTETSTTLTTPTESAKNNTIVYPDSPNAVAPIEDKIPNTGSTKAIYAAAALAIAGAVALLIIKRKSDD